MNTVYVLECNNNKYYIGKTSRSVNIRFKELRNGSGSEWTRQYRPIRIVESEKTVNLHLELNKTLDYMNEYGIDNVRGSCYSSVNLSKTEKRSIRQLLSSRNDSCYNYGMTGNFAKYCGYSYNKNNHNSYGSFKRGSPIHFANECDNYFDENDVENNENNSYYGESDDNSYICFKCGSSSHYVNNCGDSDENDGENDENDSENDDDNPYRCFRCGSPSQFDNYRNDYSDENDSYDENGGEGDDGNSYRSESDDCNSYRCFKCGNSNHFANNCDDESDIEMRLKLDHIGMSRITTEL
ncbi:unnamed protein product [Rhizophagus irregularis]|uniref:Nucleic acid binding protein / zinc ion binding protein n=1 Tax=Rhizophagus irregularis TaxID=588596 RepID=A0A2I1HDX8_9GLOM|nr:hypothetical protein RhiirA4_509076 [Rhizophagus irregularis]CAB4444270.1 unnamed protein product [Rhizophagus irregularis]